ncbi:MAG: bifunctional UDP-N-acetylglucosamine diphosphorylase/glucosamine-1-phosphate N-acetyltransferase GlmU [Alphaproteobacteria bacterium]|nr:bifunctional UDP-N-acetylglucosamine diphosphorylase/glucosamine-1-phosphate N-acetyltransferase GlmU [Alphaproteobacteria bacterium]
MAKPTVIILAAGEGTRMRSSLPKVLHPVCGRAMIGHVLAAATGGTAVFAPGEVMVVTAPGDDAVRAAVAPARSTIQDKPRGTGDAVRAGLDACKSTDGPVVIAYGDMPLITAGVFARLMDALFDGGPGTGPGVAILGFEMDGDHAYGRLVMGADGGLERIVEAGDADAEEKSITLCNSGLMAASSGDFLAQLVARLGTDNAKGEYYLTEIVALARQDGVPVAVVKAEADDVLGVNTRADLAVAEATMQTRLRGAAMAAGATLIDPTTVYLSFDTSIGTDVVIGPHVWFGPGVCVGDGVEIRPYCHMEGAVIAEDAIIGPFSRLRPGAEIGAGAHIGNFVEIKAARVETGAKINHLAYVGDARVGADANIGAGTITCNYDGFDKHMTDIGAGAFIGSNVALVAPLVVGDGAVIGAGSVITGDVPADAMAIARGKQKSVPGGGARFRARKSTAASNSAASNKVAGKTAGKEG